MRGDHVAVALADLFRGDGEILASGIGPLPNLGARLAQATFEPDLVITDGVAHVTDRDGAVQSWMPYRKVFDVVWWGKRHVVMGASQIDRHGRTNISCIGDHRKPKVQLLGSRGAPGNTVCHRTSYYVPKHGPRVVVPEVSFVSGAADKVFRMVSDLGVFEFVPTMTVVALHPGVTIEQVQEATGFEVAFPSEIPVTRGPTDEEAEWLQRLDPGRKRRQRADA